MVARRAFGALIPDAEGMREAIERQAANVPTLDVARVEGERNAGTFVHVTHGAPFGQAVEHLRAWLCVWGLSRFQLQWRDAPCEGDADAPGA